MNEWWSSHSENKHKTCYHCYILTLAWGIKLIEVKSIVQNNIYGKNSTNWVEAQRIKINRIGLWLLGEGFLRETNFKANCRDFGRHGKEVYVGVCTFGNKETIQDCRRKRSRYLKLVSWKTKKVTQRKASQSTWMDWRVSACWCNRSKDQLERTTEVTRSKSLDLIWKAPGCSALRVLE